VVAALAEAGAHVLALDVTDESSRRAAIVAVEAEHGAVGALINNAGYAQADPVDAMSLDAVRAQFETNVFGLIRLCQLALPGMRERGSGTIVNLGSAGGLMVFPGSSAYDMTKWSPEAFSDAPRAGVRRFGVRVVLLEPGGVPTNFAAVQAGTWPDSSNSPYTAFRAQPPRADGALRNRRRSRSVHTGQSNGCRIESRSGEEPARPLQDRRARIMPLLYRTLPNRTWDRLVSHLFPMT
jgi:NADP-dependent 3-hydroxy acid dehydrogenase YdfG